MKTYKLITLIFMTFALFMSCEKADNITLSDELPPMYPDYTDIIIPYNIAPLNFVLRNNPSQIKVTLKGASKSIKFAGISKIQFSNKRWKKFLNEERGNEITVQIIAKVNGQRIKYKDFKWHISSDEIDRYLTYRLIEPGYEVWNKIQLCERNLENFSVKVFADNNLIDNSCMNCHITASGNPLISFFHIRGKNGGTVLNLNGKLRKINTRTEAMFAPGIYGDIHQSGRYAVFSSNTVIPEFHTLASKKLEVFDKESDLFILDLDNNKIINSPVVSGNNRFETFPVFSSEGNRIYFCAAPSKLLPDSIYNLKYSLCAIDFDINSGQFGNVIDTLIYMDNNGKSISFPRPSPDGHFILYCVSDYGTFPVWHRETDLYMLDLKTGNINDLSDVNSEYSDTYHSWSSNSKWFVFASKRDDGLYGKPYFCHVDENGIAHKPFVLPQKDPYFYDYSLKSFNIPELSKGKLPFSATDIERLYRNGTLEQFK